MTPDEAHRRAADGDIVLIDVRNPDEWRRTGLAPSAVPISMQDPAFLDKLMGAIEGDASRPLAIVCAAGGRSAQVAAALSSRGFAEVHNVVEGMTGSPVGPGWLGRGLPVVAYEE